MFSKCFLVIFKVFALINAEDPGEDLSGEFEDLNELDSNFNEINATWNEEILEGDGKYDYDELLKNSTLSRADIVYSYIQGDPLGKMKIFMEFFPRDEN